MNKCTLVGRLTRDPELRKANDKSVLSYSLACDDERGKTEFINCVSWNKQAELISQYLSKGAMIAIDGRITTSNYEGKNGNKIYVTQVVTSSVQFLSPPKKKNNETNVATESQTQPSNVETGHEIEQEIPGSYEETYAMNLTQEATMEEFDIAPEDLPF